MAGTTGGVRLAIAAPCRTAGNMGNHLPEAGIQRCIRPDNGAHQREKAAQNIWPMRHDFHEFSPTPLPRQQSPARF